MKNFHLIILFAFYTSCYSQQDKTLMLWNKVVHAKTDTARVNTLNELFYCFNENNNDSALKIAEQALQLSIKINYIRGQASANNNIGTLYYYKGNNPRALTYYLTSIKLLEGQGENVANTLIYQKQLSSVYNNIGTIYQRQKLFAQAESYFRKAIAIDEKMGDKSGLSHVYNNIGTIKEETNKYDEAIVNYELSLKLKEETNDTAGMPSTLINMGVIQMNRNKFKEAKEYFDKALVMIKITRNLQDEALVFINLGDLYHMQSNYATSVPYYEKGIDVCKKQQYKQFLSYAYNSLSMSYFRMKHFEKAYEFYQMHIRVKDSLFNNENSKVLSELETKYGTETKEKEIKLLTSHKEIQDLELMRKKIIIYVFIGGSILLVFFVGLTFRAYRHKKKANNELDIKNHKIEYAYKIIEEKQKEIVDSINYAKRIQYTLLARKEFLLENLAEHFILFKPKDIVSGDFYWATKQDNRFYLAVCDSTGHGVPGAFMSLLSIGFLSEAINEKGIRKPNEIFNYVRGRLVDNMSTENQKDGFDGILLCIDNDLHTITYSAAHNNPVLIQDGIIKHLPTDKMPVGIGEKKEDFNLFEVNAQKGSILYLYTDGYPDQFGGPKGKKFKYKQLEEMLLSNHTFTMEEQLVKLDVCFEDWRGELEQVDDVCIIGLRI